MFFYQKYRLVEFNCVNIRRYLVLPEREEWCVYRSPLKFLNREEINIEDKIKSDNIFLYFIGVVIVVNK